MTVSSRFSPRALEHAQLERLTVAREELLARLQDAVTGAVVSGQARFDLVLGPRGAGKSHLIGVLDGRLRSSPQLSDRTIVIAPPEEIHSLSLVQFLAQLLAEFPDDAELGPAADAVRSLQRQRDGDQERRAVALIRGRLRKRSLIILLENLDELFTALGREGQQRLRNILQTERRWSIVATSRSLSPSFTKYEAPFHGTFNVHRLEPLSAEQCRDMLAALADAHGKVQLAKLLREPKGLARVRGLHHLLGGNPRAMSFLFRQLDEHRLDQFELALADLADELKPYFQEQMTRISPMQRALMELLAESWRPLTVTELAERSFSAQASTSSALRHLRSEALVQTLEVGRERYYELGDPLLRLARANERPRDAIAAFALVVRWWYAEDSENEFGVRSRYVLSAQARAELAAREQGEGDAMLVASLREAHELLAQPPGVAVERARKLLGQRQLPVVRAALALILERSGDEAGAVEALLSGLGPQHEVTMSGLVALSVDWNRHAGAVPPNLEHLWLASRIAQAFERARRASCEPKDPEVRRALLSAFDEESAQRVRLLSDIVIRWPVIERWSEHGAHADLGQLLARLRVSRSTPVLEVGLARAIDSAWHHQRLDALLPATASLDSLVAVLPKSARLLVGMASVCTLPEHARSQTANDAAESVRARWMQMTAEAPEGALTRVVEQELALPGIVLEALTVFAELPEEEWKATLPSWPTDTQSMAYFAVMFGLGFYRWLASRRPLEPLVRLAARLRELHGFECFPVGPLNSAGVREAVARLSEPERAIVRATLVQHNDRNGLAALALDATR